MTRDMKCLSAAAIAVNPTELRTPGSMPINSTKTTPIAVKTPMIRLILDHSISE